MPKKRLIFFIFPLDLCYCVVIVELSGIVLCGTPLKQPTKKVNMRYLLYLSLLISISGCTESGKKADYRLLSVKQAKSVIAQYKIAAPVDFKWDKKPFTDGQTIYISLPWAAKFGLSNVLGPILQHEQNHIYGYDHCDQPKCLMYYEYGTYSVKKMCDQCQRSLTSQFWLTKALKQ